MKLIAFVVLAGMLMINNGCAKNESEHGKKSLVVDEYASVQSISPEVVDRVKPLDKYRDEKPKLHSNRKKCDSGANLGDARRQVQR